MEKYDDSIDWVAAWTNKEDLVTFLALCGLVAYQYDVPLETVEADALAARAWFDSHPSN